LDELFELQKKLIPYMIWIDIWKIWHACSSFLSTYLHYLLVCIYIISWRFYSLFITQWTNFFSVSTLKWYLHTPLFYHILSYWIICIVVKHQILH
jgi:hypothetical protein